MRFLIADYEEHGMSAYSFLTTLAKTDSKFITNASPVHPRFSTNSNADEHFRDDPGILFHPHSAVLLFLYRSFQVQLWFCALVDMTH